MKKILPILFVMALTLGISTAVVAFAEENRFTYTATEERTFKEVVKTYSSENDVVVKETLRFTSTANTNNPGGGTANLIVGDEGNVEVDSSHELTETDFSDNIESDLVGTKGTVIPVTIPSLGEAGTYEWTIKENAGSIAGVKYNTGAEVHIIVLVAYNNTNYTLEIANIDSYIKLENGKKAKTLDNTFESGTFTVAKDVTGNMANANDKFEITVTLTSNKKIGTNVSLAGVTIEPEKWTEVKDDDGVTTGWKYVSTLNYSKADGAKTFSDIPVGVKVTVEENKADNKMNGYEYVSTKMDGEEFTELTVADDTNAAIIVTNKKGASIDTGISLDSLPYAVMLSAACVGLFLFVSRKRTM